MQLTPEAAAHYFEIGAFIVVADLPKGSEVGIDGEAGFSQNFNGYKMIPPGLHLFTYSPPPKSNENPSNMAIRRGVLRFLESKQTLVYKYSAIEEVLVPNVTDAETGEELETRLTSDQLKTLDPKLAAYPLYKGNIWKKLTSAVKQKDVDHLIGKGGLVDSLMESPADEEVHIGKAEGAAEGAVLASASEDGLIQFVAFDAKRSWREGAVGEEISAFAMDKSWLWMDVVTRQFQGDPSHLLAQLQLAFVFFLHVQNFAALVAFKRLLSLCAGCARLHRGNLAFYASSPAGGSVAPTEAQVKAFYKTLIITLEAQLTVLPETFFTDDLAGTGMEQFWSEETERLVKNYASNTMAGDDETDAVVKALCDKAKKFGWELGRLEILRADAEADDIEEEDEDAPVVVDL